MSEALAKVMWTEEFLYLMEQCFYFLSYEWNVFGFKISFLNCIVMTECFYLLMNFIARIFGKEEFVDGGE